MIEVWVDFLQLIIALCRLNVENFKQMHYWSEGLNWNISSSVLYCWNKTYELETGISYSSLWDQLKSSLSSTSFSALWALYVRGPPPLPSPLTRAPRGLVLSKLCQPCNDLQQRIVSLLIRRPSPWPSTLCLGIPLPHHLPDPPCLHPPSVSPTIRPSPQVLLSVPAAHVAGWCLLRWRQPIRGLTSSVSKTWLTGQPQRLPATISGGRGVGFAP